MAGEQASSADAAKGEAATRQRSSISFPYTDLKSGVEMAEAIHNHVGLGDCTDDQLAAWTDQSPKSSGFRVQVYASRIFGVIAGENDKHRLTDLGRAIVDPNRSREAKARAFLTAPLFKAVYDKYQGGVIPPAAALERDFVGLGVSEKQKDRARQVFERSAEQAGFFEHGKNRLVPPGVMSAARDETPTRHGGGGGGGNPPGGGGGGGGTGWTPPPTMDPLVGALIQKLPQNGGQWGTAERVAWLQMMAMAFQMAYGPESPIEIKAS